SQPMDRASTEAAFSLIYGGEPVKGAFSWSEDSRSLTFQPEPKLNIESMYVVTLAPTARGASGESTLEEGLNYLFSTVPYPGISATSPTNGEQDVYPGGGVSIYFKSPMDTNTFEGKAVIISPEGVEWKPVVYGDDSFYMDFTTQPNTTYTIQFNRGAVDVYGNAIETDYLFTFKTGEIESSAWMPYIYGLALTNAYRDDTRLAMSVNGKPEVGFRLHRIKTEDMGLALHGYYDDYVEMMRRSDEVRIWEENLDAGPTLYGVDEVLLASEDGGKLPPGVYLFSAKSPNTSDWQIIPLAVVNANLTVKGVEGEQLVWVTDMQTAAPIEGVKVTFYNSDGREIAAGTTGDDGVYRLSDTPDISSIYYMIAQSETVYGVWTSAGAYSLLDDTGYVYTDRPIYRPGETVYFRGVIRDRHDMVFTPPDAASVMVHIDVNWQSQMLLEQEVKLTEFGTFSGELKLPDDVQLGQANISVTYHTSYEWLGSFTIAEFRVPEYKVEVTPDNDTIIQGDPVKAVVAASYYFGGPVSGATLNWNAYGEASWFNYTGPGRYNFVDDSQDYFSWVEVGSGSTQTDSNGRVMVELNNTKAPSIRPMTISLEGQVVDESGQYISGRTSIMAHPAEVYVGLHTDRYFGQENVPLNVDLIAVTPDSIPLAEQKIEITVVETRWERVEIEGQFGQYDWTSKEIEVQTAQVVTGSDGTAKFEFTPPQSGLYVIRALTRDQRERVNRSALHLWVTGRIPVWWGRPSNTIDLIADKDSYQPGDTAEVLVPIPFSGVSHVLITVERAGIQQYEVFRVEGSTLVYKLPITDQHVPTIYITATLMKGMDEESLNPQYRTGSLALTVEPVNQRLQVTITPSATLAQPGDTVALDIKTV
ncbi:MAG: Ig-like domain-containing protein, partial [Chloroflexi bacterium]|nr:Ig-like domain-containing protein [Chloroflexota bacterium]